MPDEPRRRYGLKASYPDVAQSARLCVRQPAVRLAQPEVRRRARGGVPDDDLDGERDDDASRGPSGVGRGDDAHHARLRSQPGAGAVDVALLLALFVTFTDTHSRHLPRDRRHGARRRALRPRCSPSAGARSRWRHGWLRLAVHARRVVAVLVGAGGWLAGSFLTGLYLLVSLNVFGRHSEEAFSALRIQDYKNFLRLHIARGRDAHDLPDQAAARAAPVAHGASGGLASAPRRASFPTSRSSPR